MIKIDYYFLGLSNMCNIAHVNVTKSNIFSLKTNDY